MHNIESLRSCRGCCCGARRGAYKGLVIYSKLPGARVCLHDHEQRSLIQQMKAESTIFSLYYCAGGHGHTELKIFFQNIDFPLFVPTIPPPNPSIQPSMGTTCRPKWWVTHRDTSCVLPTLLLHHPMTTASMAGVDRL